MNEGLGDILETTEPVQVATGFAFTEGPCWHPDGFYYFVDLRSQPSRVMKVRPGDEPELVRASDDEVNGVTYDLAGNLVWCESANRRIGRMYPDGSTDVVCDNIDGKRINRPNDVICRSDGSIYFTDPNLRIPAAEREIAESGVYRVDPDGATTLIGYCEYPNGLAFSPDERTLYVANTRHSQYLIAFDLDETGKTVTRRRIHADMSPASPAIDGVPDGLKVDVAGNIFCTGVGGVWVISPEGVVRGIIEFPEVPANVVFGGDDLRTLFATARTSVYTIRVKTPGLAHPWLARR
ncbi:MAG: SMP-30/gluconolactonase/LRE family protein [Dehalococcoidia bacterium]